MTLGNIQITSVLYVKIFGNYELFCTVTQLTETKSMIFRRREVVKIKINQKILEIEDK